MINKKKTIIIIAIIALAGIGASGLVLARDLQVNYPQNGPTTTNIGLHGYVSYIYRFMVALAGLIAFGSLMIAGFRYLTSAGNPQAMNSARNQMAGAIVGLLLLLGAHIILRTINPRFVGLEPEELKPNSGICLHDSSDNFICYSSSPQELPKGFEPEQIEFLSPWFVKTEGGTPYQSSNTIRRVFTFNNKNWEADSGKHDSYIDNTKMYPSDSGSLASIPNSTGSLYIEWGRPGIYLFKEPYSGNDPTMDFPNTPYRIQSVNAPELTHDYNDKVSAIQFRPFKCLEDSSGNYCPEVRYGAVLHTESDYEGQCAIAYGGGGSGPGGMGASFCAFTEIKDLSSGAANNFPVPAFYHNSSANFNNNVSSLTVFNHACQGHNTGKITFYEQTARSGDYFEIGASNVGGYLQIDNLNYPLSGSVNYSGKSGFGGGSVPIQDGDDALNDKEIDEILSMKVEGHFLVVVTRENNFGGHCDTFEKTVSTFNGKYVIRGDEDAKIHSIAIIPIKE